MSDDKNVFNSIDGVEQTSSKSFHDFITTSKKNDKIGLFVFYAPWCPHCVSKREFLTDLVKTFGKIVKVHTYNCVALAETDEYCKGIKKFPTMFMVHKGNKYQVRDVLEIMVSLVAMGNSMKTSEVLEVFRDKGVAIDDNKKKDVVANLK